MKPEIAIVEPAHDIAKHAAAVDAALRNLNEAKQHEGAAESRWNTARHVTARMRVELGHALAAARKCWPASGKNAKGWTDFLRVRGIDPDVADDAMKYAGHIDEHFSGAVPEKPPTLRDAGIDRRPLASEDDDDEPVDVLGRERDVPPFRQMTEGEWIQGLGRLDPEVRRRIMDAAGPLPAPAPALALTPDPTTANVHGGSGERKRGSYCTPKKLAHAVGPFDVDPFSNPRSHVAAVDRCMLENGGDGLVVGEPGSYRVGADGMVKIADTTTRVWIQPDYRIVLKAIAHYGNTRFTALLRFAPDTRWFRAMWPRVAVVAVPMERIPFETPDGIEIVGADEGEDAGAPFPHVLYYTDPRDISDEIAQTCILLNRYEALRLVR